MKKIYAKFLFWLENYLQKRGKKFKNKKQNFYRIFLSFLYINIETFARTPQTSS
jgi:hypothetical protein